MGAGEPPRSFWHTDYMSSSSNTYAQWDDLTRLSYDACARQLHDAQSLGPGQYSTGQPGHRTCATEAQYSTFMTEPAHYQKVYRETCKVSEDSELRITPLTKPKLKNQLFTRPYLGSFRGAGTNTGQHKDIESRLIVGDDTRGGVRRACDVLSEVTIDRFECLPEYGNPQRVEHIVEPWVRGGSNTRDYVRRVNYEARLKNKLASQSAF